MKYFAYTDGSSRGNPGAAGWATIIMNSEKVREYNGHNKLATNNQMEIYAVLFAMSFATQNLNTESSSDDEIEIYSDSLYVVKGVNEWVYSWTKNNWKNSQKKEVLNKDLWQKMWGLMNDLVYKNIKYKVIHIKGHAGHKYNERADLLCTSAALEDDIVLYNGKREDYDDYVN